jgi:hypothetical protein
MDLNCKKIQNCDERNDDEYFGGMEDTYLNKQQQEKLESVLCCARTIWTREN